MSCSVNMHVSDHSFYFYYQMNNKGKSKSSKESLADTNDNKVGQLFPNSSLEDYAKKNGVVGKHDDGKICDSKHDNDDESEEEVNDDEDDNDSANEERDEDDSDKDESDHDQMNAKKEWLRIIEYVFFDSDKDENVAKEWLRIFEYVIFAEITL